MPDHLTRRGGVWWVRLVVPVRLRAVAGRREFTRSCRTSDLQAAKAVAAMHLGMWRRQLLMLDPDMHIDFPKLLAPAPALTLVDSCTLEDAEAFGISRDLILKSPGVQLFCRLDQVRGKVCRQDDLERDPYGFFDVGTVPDDIQESIRSGLHVLDDCAGAWIDHIHVSRADVVQLVAVSAGEGRLFIPNEVQEMKVGRLEVSAAFLNDLRTKLLAQTTPEDRERALQPVVAPGATHVPPDSRKRLREAIDAYRDDPSGLPGRLRNQTEQRHEWRRLHDFADYMGNMELWEVTPELLRQYRDGPLKSFPANVNNIKKPFKRATLKETAEALTLAGIEYERMSPGAQKERMEKLGTFFAWVSNNRRWLQENPAAPLVGEHGTSKAERIDANRQKKEEGEDEEGRRPFSDKELALIFGVPHYRTGDGRHVTRGNETWYPFQYWLPLLALHHGCRISEACQLHLEDVKRINGIWILDLNENTKDKSIKTDGTSRRRIPVHPKVIELGFLDYCERLRSEGFRRVFPELSYSTTPARYSKEPKRKMSSMLKSLGMPRDGTLVFHNFRKNANDAFGHVRIPGLSDRLLTFVQYDVMGHKLGDDVNVNHYTSCTMEERAALVSGVEYDCTAAVAKFDVDYGVEQVRLALTRKKKGRAGQEDMGPLNVVIYGT